MFWEVLYWIVFSTFSDLLSSEYWDDELYYEGDSSNNCHYYCSSKISFISSFNFKRFFCFDDPTTILFWSHKCHDLLLKLCYNFRSFNIKEKMLIDWYWTFQCCYTIQWSFHCSSWSPRFYLATLLNLRIQYCGNNVS